MAGYACVFLAVSGILLVWFFSPEQKYAPRSISEIRENCEGYAQTTGKIIRAFYSKKANYIGLLAENNDTVLVKLDGSFFEGDRIKVFGSASEYSGECWLFPEKVERI